MTIERESGTRVRIGELSRRTGVSDHVLRAWERRYDLLEPVRTEGGYRLYSSDDELRVQRMVELLDRGISPAEAAKIARSSSPEVPLAEHAPEVSAPGLGEGLVRRVWGELHAAVASLDEGKAQRAVDELFAGLAAETAVRDLLMPFLHDLGERWERGEVSVAQEHFISQLLRSRLAALARGYAASGGARAVLACPPDERHDIALLACALVLRRQGWAVTFLGADTPIRSLAGHLGDRPAEVLVLSAAEEGRFLAVADDLAALAAHTRMYLAGPGATDGVVTCVGAMRLAGDPVTAAMSLAGAR